VNRIANPGRSCLAEDRKPDALAHEFGQAPAARPAHPSLISPVRPTRTDKTMIADTPATSGSGTVGGHVPVSVQHTARLFPDLMVRHAQDRAFATPKTDAALSEERHTLVHLAVARATGSRACVEVMTDKSRNLGIERAKLVETVTVARFAAASQVPGNAEPLLAALDTQPGR
jgi:alkylhydroperoxidase/carboxymuconolactone decarboxylase family protein YurZ